MVGDLHVGTLASTMVVGRNYIYTSLDVPMKLIYKISIHTFPVIKTIFFFRFFVLRYKKNISLNVLY